MHDVLEDFLALVLRPPDHLVLYDLPIIVLFRVHLMPRSQSRIQHSVRGFFREGPRLNSHDRLHVFPRSLLRQQCGDMDRLGLAQVKRGALSIRLRLCLRSADKHRGRVKYVRGRLFQQAFGDDKLRPRTSLAPLGLD